MKDHISICIPTYNRNCMLERLLHKLAMQDKNDSFEYSLVIVDNDAEGGARLIVEKMQKDLCLEIIYSVEPERSIARVRNHALRYAKGNYIAIIDDDEFPPQDWLIKLYSAIQTFDVDGALGPVYPFFDRKPPDWLTKGNFCERPVYRTGTLLRWNQTRTGNVLLKRDVFDKLNLHFDENFKTGGSDQAFFKQAMECGFSFVAVEEAPVYEVVSSARWAKSYYIKRALINGFNAHKYSLLQPVGISRISATIKSLLAMTVYTIAIPFSILLGTHRLMQCLEKGCFHFSRVLAVVDIELIKKRNF